jgi:tRNA threonylcarbamoyladenosine biosynthesis protein TsaE
MSAPWSLATHSPEETAELGALAAAAAPQGLCLALRGELGTGKTVFVRGLTQALLGQAVAVTSPTYVLEHVYRGSQATVYHLDLYRLTGGAADFAGAGLGECLEDPQGVVCIEWAERAEGFLPTGRVEVHFRHLGPNERGIEMTALTPRGEAFLERLAAHCTDRQGGAAARPAGNQAGHPRGRESI